MSTVEESPGRAVDRSEWRLLAMVLTVCFAAFALAIRMRMNVSPAGDEPAYLVISQTFQKYHSINVMQDYNHQDYRSFYDAYLTPHVGVAPNGRPEPVHNFGGPLLWLIPFIIWGRVGAAGFVGALSLLIVWNIYYFVRERGIGVRYALLTTLLMALASPIYMYASMTFIEPIAALLLLYAIRVMLAPRPAPARLLLAGLALGYLPWLHPRFLPFAPIVGAILLWRLRRASLPALVPIAVSLVLLELYSIIQWGAWTPFSNLTGINIKPFEISPLIGLSGVLIDEQYGLLVNFPLFLLLLPGLLLALRSRQWRADAAIGVVVLPYLLVITTFHGWQGAYAPPARFIMVLVPIMSYYIAYALQRLNLAVADCAAVLVGAATLALSVVSDVVPSLRYSPPGEVNRGMRRLGQLLKVNFVQYLPNVRRPVTWLPVLTWLGGAVLIGVAIWAYASRRPDPDRTTPAAAPAPPVDPVPSDKPVAEVTA